MNYEKYNGWSNYATWRINLELFSNTNFVEEDFFDGKCELKSPLSSRKKCEMHAGA